MAPLNPFGTRPLTPEERTLVLRSMAVIAVPLALIVILAVVIGGTVGWIKLNDAIDSNVQAVEEANDATDSVRQLTLDLNAERTRSEHIGAWKDYDACVENENQDAVTADLLRKFRTLTLQGPSSPARDAVLDALQGWLDAREPPGEKDCTIPPYPRPRGQG